MARCLYCANDRDDFLYCLCGAYCMRNITYAPCIIDDENNQATIACWNSEHGIFTWNSIEIDYILCFWTILCLKPNQIRNNTRFSDKKTLRVCINNILRSSIFFFSLLIKNLLFIAHCKRQSSLPHLSINVKRMCLHWMWCIFIWAAELL